MKLHWGLLKDILALASVIVVSLSAVMFMFRILNYAEYIFASGDSLVSMLMFVVFLLPAILKVVLPIALFASCVIVFLRMSGDRELEAWCASGVNVLTFCKVPFVLGMLGFVFCLWSSLYLEPQSRQEFRKFKWMNVRNGVETLIENRLQQGTFLTDLFKTGGYKLTLHFDKIGKEKTNFFGVFLAISDENETARYFVQAEKGSLKKEDTLGVSDYVFTLENGTVFSRQIQNVSPQDNQNSGSVPAPVQNWDTLQFGRTRLSLLNIFSQQFDPGKLEGDDMRSMGPQQYLDALAKLRRDNPDWRSNSRIVREHRFFYEQIAFPLGCLFLPCVGVCLGMQDPRRKSTSAYLGMGICLAVFYAGMTLGSQLVIWNLAPPSGIVWVSLISGILMCALVLRWRYKYPFSMGFIEFLKGNK